MPQCYGIPTLPVLLLGANIVSKFCRYLLEAVSLRVPKGKLRDLTLLGVDLKDLHCPSAGCLSAANTISTDIDVFNGQSVLIKDLLDFLKRF